VIPTVGKPREGNPPLESDSYKIFLLKHEKNATLKKKRMAFPSINLTVFKKFSIKEVI